MLTRDARAPVWAPVVTAVAGLVAVVAVVVPATPAWAAFQDVSVGGPLSVGAATLAPPTAPTATPSCVLLAQRMTVSWTQTASAYATGYRIDRRTGAGAFTQVGTVTGRGTTSFVDTTVAASTTYTYQIATVFRNWTATSSAVTATTLNGLCL